jgi:Holliday junction resolvase RusA-like endonuclease
MGKYSIKLEISIAPTDSNNILGINKFAKGNIFKKVKNEVVHLAHGKRPVTPLTSFKISAERFSPQYMDLDNCYSLLKPYIDGLKLAGIIADDSFKYLKHENYIIAQTKSKDKKIIIQVEET